MVILDQQEIAKEIAAWPLLAAPLLQPCTDTLVRKIVFARIRDPGQDGYITHPCVRGCFCIEEEHDRVVVVQRAIIPGNVNYLFH